MCIYERQNIHVIQPEQRREVLDFYTQQLIVYLDGIKGRYEKPKFINSSGEITAEECVICLGEFSEDMAWEEEVVVLPCSGQAIVVDCNHSSNGGNPDEPTHPHNQIIQIPYIRNSLPIIHDLKLKR